MNGDEKEKAEETEKEYMTDKKLVFRFGSDIRYRIR
jgi:hypothetical protein